MRKNIKFPDSTKMSTSSKYMGDRVRIQIGFDKLQKRKIQEAV